MEWYDYESLNDANKSIDKQDGDISTVSNCKENCSALIGNDGKDASGDVKEEGKIDLDDVFQSMLDVKGSGQNEMNGDEQTLCTEKSGRSNKSMKSQRSQQSDKSSRSNLSLTEQLDMISKDEGKKVDDDETSASAMTWFSWRRTNKAMVDDSVDNIEKGLSHKLGKKVFNGVDKSDDRSGDSSSDVNPGQTNPRTEIVKEDKQVKPIYSLEEIENVHAEMGNQLDLDFASDLVSSNEYGSNFIGVKDVDNEHPIQALFDIIEQGFDSIDPFYRRGMERALNTNEVKLCFAAYVFVFSPPVPTHFAKNFNHGIDEDLRYERLQQGKTGPTKQGWFKWKSGGHNNNGAATKLDRTASQQDDEDEYTYEIVPSIIVFAVWTEVLLNFGINLSKLSEEKRGAALAYLQESLVQLGLLDSSFIELSERMTSDGATVNTEECEYIAVRHAINGQYGQYLRDSYTKLGECLEHNKVSIFHAASKITSATDLSMQDYSSGMLPYTLIRALDFPRVQKLLCDETFVRRRLDYFGLLEGTTIQITDIEIMIENYQAHQRHDNILDISEFVEGSHQSVKDRAMQIISHQDGALESGQCEEVGKVFHMLAVSLIEHNMDVQGLEFLNEAKEFKKRGQSPLDSKIGNITLSDTLHCIGVAYGNIGDWDNSLSHFKQALVIRRKLLGGDDLRVAGTCQKMGSALCEVGKLDDSTKLLEEALRIRQDNLDAGHESIAETEEWMGNVLREQRDFGRALEFYRRSLISKRNIFGDSHEEVANAIYTLAITLDCAGQYEPAIMNFKEALRIRNSLYGRGKILADTHLCMGNSYLELGMQSDAYEHFKESVLIREDMLSIDEVESEMNFTSDLSPQNDEFTQLYSKLIECYEAFFPLYETLHGDTTMKVHYLKRMGEHYFKCLDYNKAMGRFLLALEIEGNHDTVELQQYVGKISILNGNYEAAKKILLQCLIIQKAEHGDTSLVLFRTMYYLGIALHHMGQHSHSVTILVSAEMILQDIDADIRIAHVHFWAGRGYYAEKQYHQSAGYFLKALAGYKEFSRMDDIDIVVQTLHSLGNAQSAMGENQLALKSYNGAIKLVEKEGKMQCPKSYAEVLFSTGKLYYDLKIYDDARMCYEKSLQSLPAGSGDKVATTMGALGAVYIKQVKYHEAKEVLTGAYNMFNQSIGQNSDTTISTAYQLAQLLDLMHDFMSAKEYYEICLKANELKHGKTHIAVGTILFNMGKNLLSQFEYDSSLACLERALAIRKKDLPPNHSDCACTFYELGKCYVARDKTDKGILCYREAHRIWKLNHESSDAGVACFDLAGLYEEQQQNSLAASSYSECLELLPSESKRRPQLHYRLGTLYNILDNAQKAIYHYSQYILNITANGNEAYIVTMRSLAHLYAKERQFEESFEMYNKLIQFLEVTDDDKEGELATAYHDVGKVHVELRNFDEALQNMQTSIDIRKATENSNEHHIAIGKTLLDLAKVFFEKGQYASATNILLEALFLFKLKRNHADRILALHELARLYEIMEKREEAKECFEDILEIQKDLLRVSESSIADTLCKFGSLLVNMSETKRALELFQQALSKYEKMSPASLSHVATLQKIGELHMENMQYDKALRTLDKAITLWPDECLEEAADCNRNAAVIHFSNGERKKAIPYLQEAVRMYQNCSVGDERLSSSLYLLGKALSKTSDLPLARKCLTEALLLREVIPGISSLEYAQSLASLGEVEYKQDQPAKALPLLLKAMDIYTSSPKKVVWDYVEVQDLVGRIYYSRKDYVNARKTVDSSFLICNKRFPDEVEMISNLHLLRGKLHVVQKNLDEAYDQFKRCLSLRKRNGKEKQSVVEVLMEIAGVLFEQNQHKSCLHYYQEVVRIMQLLNQREGAATIYEKIGISHLHLENYEDAMHAFREVDTFYSGTLENIDDRQRERAHLSYNMGRAYEGLKRVEEALASYLDSIGSFGLIQTNSNRNKEILSSAMHHTGCLLAQKPTESDRTIRMLEKALEIRREILGEDDVEIADTLYHLAKILSSSAAGTTTIITKGNEIEKMKDMFIEAESIFSNHKRYREQSACLSELGSLELLVKPDKSFMFFKKAWSIYLTHKLEQGSEAGNILYGMGFVHNQKLKASTAADLLKQSLKLRIKYEGKNSINVGKTCEQLGSCLMALGQHEDALKLYVTCLEIYKDELGMETMECARVMLDIAALYSYKQQFDLALLQLTGSLDFMENEYGSESEQVATVLLRIGQVHDMRIDNEEAMKCVSRALQIRIKLYTNEDIRVAETYLICAKLLEDWGDIEEAVNCYQSALAIFQLKKGLEDTHVATIHDQIAGIYVEQGDYDSAIESYNEALSIYQVQLGERSSEVGHTLRNLGAIYDSKQDYETSYAYYMDSLKILRQSLGDNDLSVGLVLNNIGVNLARQKKYRKAIDLCTVALRIRRSQLPKNHLEIADTLTNLAHILDDCNKDSQAIKFYTEALSIYKSNSGNESEDIANALKNIGCINIRQDDLPEATANLSEALDIFKMKQGADSIEVANILHHLGRIYGKESEYRKSLSCFEESLKIRAKLLPQGHRDVVDTKRFVEAIRRKVDLG